MRSYLLVDVSNLAYKAMYAMPDLSFEGNAMGAVYGVFQDIVRLRERLETNKMIFCFDSKVSLRKSISPVYKGRRKRTLEMTEEEKKFREDLISQVVCMRRKYFPAIGFRNLLHQEGYEADDLIAAMVQRHVKTQFIIVSTDQDLYQLLSDKVVIYNPMAKTIITAQSFECKYGVKPEKWAKVKALAGCVSDNVIGCKGVGEVIAIKFINKKLNKKTATYDKIQDFRPHAIQNLMLTKLPFPGTADFPIEEDELSTKKWDRVMKRLGMNTLLGKGRSLCRN